MNRKEILLICVLFMIAFSLRFYDCSYPAFKWMDEAGHVPAAANYWNNGQFEPDNWEHPPLRHILLYAFLQVFGDNPYGWRMRNVLFGAVTVILLYLLASEISGSKKTAMMAALLLATDPLHIVLSRYTFEEIYGSAFFLAAIVLFLKHNRRSMWLTMSALFLGCALATKWYYVPGWLLIYLLALHNSGNYRDLRSTLFITCTYFLIPVSVYILSYYLWFGRGYSFNEFLEFISNSYHSLQLYYVQGYQPGLFFVSHISAGEWFVSPIVVGQGTFLDNNKGEFILYMNNLPIWILTIPSMIVMGILAVRKRSLLIFLPVLFFSSSYLLFLFIKRPAFIYSAVPLLPFAFTAIAYAITQLSDRYGARIYFAAMAVMLAWNTFLYPLVTAKKVNVAPYGFMLSNPDVKVH